MSHVRMLVAVIFALVSPLAMSAPCAGFTDVDDSSPFCADVEWIANRGITLGCGGGLYCPNTSVTRLAMAVFLHRVGLIVEDAAATAYPRHIGTQFTQTTPLAPGATEVVSTFGWPVDWHVLWRVVPSTTGSRLAVTNVASQNDGNGTLTYFVSVQNQTGAAAAYTLRYSVLR